MLETYLAAVGGLAILIAIASRTMRELPVSEPLGGLLVGILIGPRGLGLVDSPAPTDHHTLETAAQLLLAVSLMDIAIRYPLGELRRHLRPIVVLTVLGMVGMALVSAGLAAWILGFPLALAWLVGATLAPTDPVLSSNIVAGEPANRHLSSRVRQVISLEAGGNDALALPFVTLGMVLVLGLSVPDWGLTSAWQLMAGLSLGLGLGLAAGKLVHREHEDERMEPTSFLFFTILFAFFVLGTAEAIRADGLMAVFAGGLAYNHGLSEGERQPEERIEEAVNQFAVLPLFAILGVALPWEAWAELGWRGPVFAAAVLLLRRVPLVLALQRPAALARGPASFIGWFGPIGVGTIYYLSLAAMEGAATSQAWAAGTLLVASSTVVHGVTATPGRRLFARWSSRTD